MTTSSSSRDKTSKRYTRIPAATLRTFGPFVRKDALKAGDILLSRGQGWDSCLIALTTGGRYSHASIFLPFRFDELLPLRLDHELSVDEAKRKYGTFHPKSVHLDLVEADDEGVGAVPPRPLVIEFGGRRYDVIRLPGRKPPKAAVLLRHPDIKSVDERTLEQEVRTFSDAELMRRYSSAERLALPLALPGPVKRVLGRILLWYDPQPERLILPGCFCSELVVKFFERLRIPLFAKAAAPEHISPNHLQPSRSLLTVVPDAVFTAADIPDDAHGEVLNVFLRDVRLRYLSKLVRVREDTELLLPEIRKRIEETAAAMEKAEEATRLRADLFREKQAVDLHAQIADALSHRSIAPALRRTFYRLDGISRFLKVLRDHLRTEQVPDQAGSELRRIHDRAFLKLCSRCTRAQTLVRMSLARRLPAEKGRQEWMRALDDWRSQKARCAQAIADLKPGGPFDDETDAWVRKVLHEVEAETVAALHVT